MEVHIMLLICVLEGSCLKIFLFEARSRDADITITMYRISCLQTV